MTVGSIETLVCDDCGERVLVTDGMKEGQPKFTYFTRGWVEVQRRDIDDHLGIVKRHFCPECRPEALVR